MQTVLYKFSAFVVICILVFGLGYLKGSKETEREYIEKLNLAQLENSNKIIEQERIMNDKQNEIVSDYIKQIEDLKNEHKKDTVTINNLRDTVNVPKCVSNTGKSSSGVSKKTGNNTGLKCYTESELLRKVERSLDLAREADELAVKYNALLKVCSEQNM